MLEKTGIPTEEQLKEVTPSKERLSRGPVAIIECFQEIPCNPCYTSCSTGAIKELVDINEKPEVDFDKCNGCGICISNCPGLAIFVVDESYSEDKALIKLPYEFLPLPEKGDMVKALDRSGQVVGQAEVVKVVNSKAQDRTPVIWIAVDKELSMRVRNIEMGV
ncbi:MAG: 4Fe-4S ferredoxin, iron-sulfur binding domain protein [Firmicutes bacterium]|nr:4Fe-4S ferredoxin, iron-sulfur binding domain protein [Bacillota bacterium]MDI6704751.1 4Fe-4S binding protein [Bacillota bacterium]